MRRLSPPLFARHKISIAIGLLTANLSAVAADAGTQVAEAKFNNLFLRLAPGEQIDVSRFTRGNALLAGSYLTDISVNQVWVGRMDVSLRQVGDNASNIQPCFDRELLERMGVDLSKLSPQTTVRLQENSEACLTLPSLIEDATATFDNSDQRLDIGIPQISMLRQARGYVDPKYWDDGIAAARLQYSANMYHSDSQGTDSTQGYLGLDAGLNIGPWRFHYRSNFTHDNQTGNHYQNLQTNVQRSIVSLKSQLTIGDSFTDGALFDSVGFRGVQLATDDRMYPESQRGYAPTVRGIAQSNARVQVRQNGNILYDTTVAAGPFEINDLYPTGYGGDLDVIVTEADGSVHTSRVPYAAAVNALRPGITRYSVTAGQYRSAGIDSTPLLVQGTVQHGFTNIITGYSGVTGSTNYAAVLAGIALNTDYGAFGADITQSFTRFNHESNRSGQSVRLSYSKLVQPTNTNFTVAAYRYSSSGYLGLSDAMNLLDQDKRGISLLLNGTQKSRFLATLNQELPAGFGNFYMSGSVQNYWNRNGRDTQFQAGYNNNFKSVNYGVAVARQLDVNTHKWDNRVMLIFSIPLGSSLHAPYSTTSLQHNSTGGSSLQETVTGTLGDYNTVAYGINAGHTTGSNGSAADTSIGGNIAYTSPVATFNGSASTSSHYTQVSAGMTGGIVAYSGGIVFTPSLGETVAIVEADDAAGARLTNGNGLRIDPWGHAVVSNLTPFARNQVELDPQGLPMNVELKSTMQQIAPTAGAIVKLKFDTENAGRTAIIEASQADGIPLPFGADVHDMSGKSVGIVAQGGRIIARGLKTEGGVLAVTLSNDNGKVCYMNYQLPAEQNDPSSPAVIVKATCTEWVAGQHVSR